MKTIVIVDDDWGILDVLRLVFERVGYKVTTYADAASLLASREDMPNLFLLDNRLPGISGLELCQLLKQRPETKTIPVIILSANPEIEILAKQAGAEACMKKPFLMSELRDLVAGYI